MMQKLSFTDLLQGTIGLIEHHTAIPCYDVIPMNEPVPYYHAQIIGQRPIPHKLQWREEYDIAIHCFADSSSSVHVYELIHKLEEAMNYRIPIPEGYQILMQVPEGLLNDTVDEDGTRHAILGFKITVMYGYKTKI